MHQIKPLFDRVLLTVPQTQERPNGIIVPTSTNEKSQMMTVAALGPDCAPIFNVGQTVLVHRYAGTEIPNTDEKLFIVKQCDVLAVFESPQC